MDKNLYLIHDQSGMGVDFDVLDLIIVDNRIFVVLAPATAGDNLICSTMMEGLKEKLGETAAPEARDEERYACILEMKEEEDGSCSYMRVDGKLLEEVFGMFRNRNARRFRFKEDL